MTGDAVACRHRPQARAIGVSNYSQAHIEEIRAAGLPLPAANQLELHPWSQKTNLVAYLRENGILPIAYSSLRQSEVSGRSVAVRVDRRAEARLRPQRASASDQKGPC